LCQPHLAHPSDKNFVSLPAWKHGRNCGVFTFLPVTGVAAMGMFFRRYISELALAGYFGGSTLCILMYPAVSLIDCGGTGSYK